MYLYQIDGLGPKYFGHKANRLGCFNRGFNWSFEVAVKPGDHTLTVAFSRTFVNGVNQLSAKQDVSMFLQPAHVYELSAVGAGGRMQRTFFGASS